MPGFFGNQKPREKWVTIAGLPVLAAFVVVGILCAVKFVGWIFPPPPLPPTNYDLDLAMQQGTPAQSNSAYTEFMKRLSNVTPQIDPVTGQERRILNSSWRGSGPEKSRQKRHQMRAGEIILLVAAGGLTLALTLAIWYWLANPRDERPGDNG